MEIKKRAQAALVIITGCVLLLSSAKIQSSPLIADLIQDVKSLAQKSPLQRKLETYGNRNIMGFGYLKEILKNHPDPGFFPLTRYPYFGMNAHIVYPGYRHHIDSAMLVGIDLKPEDVRPGILQAAQPITVEKRGTTAMSFWTFMTRWDYDLINSIRLTVKNESKEPVVLRAALLHSPGNRELIGEWQWNDLKLLETLTLPLDPPVEKVYSRGSLPFILILETPAEDLDITAVEIIGIKVALDGYTVIHQEPTGFAAIKNSKLVQIASDISHPWYPYLAELTNIPAIQKNLGGARK